MGDPWAVESKKEEDAPMFTTIDKGAVLQEKRVFNDTPVNPKRCRLLLTKILYLLQQGGQPFSKQEATDLFFAVTKLFQSQDILLRRLMYLMLKELIPMSSDFIIIISSLTKDMTNKLDIYKANSMRVLCRVMDAQMLPQFERYFKQNIVSQDPSIASAALVSATHLIRTCPEVVRRWSSEVQVALSSPYSMVQYHALGLIHCIKQHDRLAVAKLVSGTSSAGGTRSSYAQCLLIRFAKQVLDESISREGDRLLFEFIEHALRSTSDIVVLEAARALCDLQQASPKEIASAVNDLQLFLNTAKPTLRFAAVRSLNKLANKYPLLVSLTNLDLEGLLNDANRNTATLAISCLLKVTGNEAGIDKLLKQITGLLSDIPDDFKIQVIDAVRALCLKFPAKHRAVMTFLSGMLREEGCFEFKQAIVNSLIGIIEKVPEAKETGLTQLCEFIEDCEYTTLATRVLYFLSQEGPKSPTAAAKYIRYIYNRTVLEAAAVRAAAVSALARYADKLPNLRPQVVILLKRCIYDSDDEVRDRATYALRLLESGDQSSIGGFLVGGMPCPVENLQTSLDAYLSGPADAPFDFASVPTASVAAAKSTAEATLNAVPVIPSPTAVSLEVLVGAAASVVNAMGQSEVAKAIAAIPQFASLGPMWKTSRVAVQLTEKETEYVVSCVKHVFAEHILLQCNVTNTMKDQRLEDVVVRLEPGEGAEDFEVTSIIPAAAVPFDTTAACYICLKYPPGHYSASFSCSLKFVVKEVDPSTDETEETGTEDEYPLENLDISVGDFMCPALVVNFQREWERLDEANQAGETYNLTTLKTLTDAVKEVVTFLSMQPCDRSEKVEDRATKHILFMAGRFVGDVPVMGRVRMRLDPRGNGVNLELIVRSTNAALSQLIASSI
eukprot:TRINITY_DN17549_c0_g1_i1.p1 TRINITY_DN17549_c0_g1~~TRINITY_DN17549_c0_g1_i1.p1  ORF type:complete len:915 (-),score=287.02 TRINITY_DN17549_c0_g1_i1:59-2746(-)